MDFYYAMTNYHVLCCLLHKICYNNNNKGVLYISTYLINNQPNIINAIKESKIFDEVYAYNEVEFKRTNKVMNKKELANEVERVFKLIDKKVISKLKQANNVYLCSDFYSLGFYVIKNKIKYNYFEDGCGTLSQPHLPLRIIEKDNPNRAIMTKQLGSFGNSDNVLKRFGSLKEQIKDYSNPKDIDFSVKDILKKLPENDINKILKAFDVKKINIKESNAVLLLTMHYNELMSIENQKYIYTKLLDYFTDEKDKIIIKPHPADTIREYEKLFNDSKEINRYMPAELFPYCLNNKFERGITCWSTSIYGLKNIIKEIVNFDEKIDKTYVDFDKYYSIVEYLKSIKTKEKINIIYRNINTLQFKRLFERYFKDYEKYYTFDENGKNSIYIVDRITDDIKDEKVISMEYNLSSSNYILLSYKKKTKEENDYVSLYNIDCIANFHVSKKLTYEKKGLNITNINNKEHKEILVKIIKNNEERTNELVDKYETAISNLKNEINKKNDEIERIYSSKSWRVTKPIRKVTDSFRKLKKH